MKLTILIGPKGLRELSKTLKLGRKKIIIKRLSFIFRHILWYYERLNT